MKKQILRLCLGITCVPVIVPVHAPAGRSLRDGGSRSAAGHPNAPRRKHAPPGRYAARRLFHRHTCHAGQCTGLALPRWPSPKPTRRMPNRSSSAGDLTNTGSDERTGARVRADVTAPQDRGSPCMGNHETTWSEERMHDIPPSCSDMTGRVAHPRREATSFLGYDQRTLHENGRRRRCGHRRPRMARTRRRPPHGPASGS